MLRGLGAPRTAMRVHRVNVFTRDVNRGNPAALVVGFKGNEQEMQKMASKINLPATVFILPPQTKDFLAHVRFFSPTAELPMCGHGALAASIVLLEGENKHAKVSTIKSEVEITRREDGLVQLLLPKANKPQFEVSIEKVCELLGLENQTAIDANLPNCVASVGVPLLFVPLLNRKKLFDLKPKREEILKWTLEKNLGGIYAYTSDVIHKDSNLHARCFNPRFNNNFEDVATGAAAGALASIFHEKFPNFREIVIEQGTILGKESQIYISIGRERLKVGGYLTVLDSILEQEPNASQGHFCKV